MGRQALTLLKLMKNEEQYNSSYLRKDDEYMHRLTSSFSIALLNIDQIESIIYEYANIIRLFSTDKKEKN